MKQLIIQNTEYSIMYHDDDEVHGVPEIVSIKTDLRDRLNLGEHLGVTLVDSFRDVQYRFRAITTKINKRELVVQVDSVVTLTALEE